MWAPLSGANQVIRPLVTASPLLTDLVSYWKLDEAAGARLDAHGTNHLTDNNTVGQDGAGVINQAAALVRANSEWLSSSALVFGAQDWTVSSWIKLTDKATYQCLVTKMLYSGTHYYEFEFDYNNSIDRFGFYLYNEPLGATVGSAVANNFGSPPVGAFCHCIFWYEHATRECGIQINNGLPNTIIATAPAANTIAPFNIGRRGLPGTYLYMGGSADEVGFWTRLLTDPEKAQLYNGGAGLGYPFS